MGELVSRIAADTGLDEARIWEIAHDVIPESRDKSRCMNCDANMEMKVHTADMHTGILLTRMAQVIRENMRKGMTFTEANRVHIPTLQASDATRHRCTAAYYLGFLVQPREWSGSGHWLITSWGWAALRGEPVNKTAKWFRGELVERGEEKTTLAEMFRTHRDKVERAIAKGRAVKSDMRADVSGYDPIQWVGFGGYADGRLL